MDDYVTVEVVKTESEAELLCSLLRSAGLTCMHRVTNRGAGAFDGLSVGGPHEIVLYARTRGGRRRRLLRGAVAAR